MKALLIRPAPSPVRLVIFLTRLWTALVGWVAILVAPGKTSQETDQPSSGSGSRLRDAARFRLGCRPRRPVRDLRHLATDVVAVLQGAISSVPAAMAGAAQAGLPRS